MGSTILNSEDCFQGTLDFSEAPAEERQDLLAKLRNSSLERDDSEEFRKYIDCQGNIYYSVTTILSNTIAEAKRRSLEKWKARPTSADDLEIACNRGTLAHSHCEYVLKAASKINTNICNSRNSWKFYEDGLARGPKAIVKKALETAKKNAPSVSCTARKYSQNLSEWLVDNVVAIHASEFSIHNQINSDQLGYAGQADALIDYKTPGNLCILDFKTSGSSKPKPDAWLDDYRIQLSAYAWGLERNTGIRVGSGLIVIARENGLQVVELNKLELAGGRLLFEERVKKFHTEFIQECHSE